MHEYDLRPQLDVDVDTVSNFDQRPLGRWDIRGRNSLVSPIVKRARKFT